MNWLIKSPIDVEVGKEYPVPTLMSFGKPVAVFPKPHSDTDPQLFLDAKAHYHIDTRFTEDGKPGAINAETETPRLRPMKCQRVEATPIYLAWFTMALYYKHRDAKNCAVCPHRGMPILNGTCAGHGLRFKDGQLAFKPPFFARLKGCLERTPFRFDKISIPVTKPCINERPIVEIVDEHDDLVFTWPQHVIQQITMFPGDILNLTNPYWQPWHKDIYPNGLPR